MTKKETQRILKKTFSLSNKNTVITRLNGRKRPKPGAKSAVLNLILPPNPVKKTGGSYTPSPNPLPRLSPTPSKTNLILTAKIRLWSVSHKQKGKHLESCHYLEN